MKCIVCDRCKTIIENPRKCRVVTCARPLEPRVVCDKGKTPYRGDDPQRNDLIWEKEICYDCLNELEAFFDAGAAPQPPVPDEPGTDTPPDPEAPGDGGEAAEGEGES